MPFLIGEADSGKTSVFSPIQGVVHARKIAKVTKQREFNKAMIDDECEVVFLDEVHAKLMDVDNWKILTQGGWTAHDEKYKSSKGFVNKCPILIAGQSDLDFGTQEDNDAMDVRLKRYRFKKLPSPDPAAFSWLREHAAECIIWAMNNAAGSQDRTRSRPTHMTPQEHDKLSIEEENEIYDLNVSYILESEHEVEEGTMGDETTR